MTPSGVHLFCFVLGLVAVNGAKLPPYIKSCKVRAPDFKKCAVENGKAAMPSLFNGDKSFGIPSFNPLHVPFIEFSSGSLMLNCTDNYIRGIPNAVLEDVDVNIEKKVVTLRGTIPQATLDINYNIGGKIAGLPLQGNGKGKIEVFESILSYVFEYKEYEQDGVKYLEITKDTFDAIPQKLTIQLDNLFNGNQLLGENTNKLLNENWQDVLNEFKPALSQIFGTIIKSILGPITKKVPLTEIFPDY